jgi:PST family polysaccharide transporter
MTLSAVGILRMLIQFVSIPIIARYLSPEEYGLAAIAMSFIILVMMIAEAGLTSSLLRLPTIRSREWHTCFWLMALLGAIAAALVVVLAPSVGWLFDDESLSAILVVLSMTVLAQALFLVPNAALQHERQFGLIAGNEVASMVASIGAAIWSATAGYGVWALVLQQIVFHVFRLLMTFLSTPYRVRCEFSLRETREHIVFGRRLLVATLVSFASRSLDNVVVGKVAGAASVGVYSMAVQFARLPLNIVTGPLHVALYPTAAAMKDDVPQMRSLFLATTRLLSAVALPGIALVAVAHAPIFDLLLSSKWAAAGSVFAFMALGAAIQPVIAIANTFLMALGRTDVQMRRTIRFCVLWISGVVACAWVSVEVVAGWYSACVVIHAVGVMKDVLPLLECPIMAYIRAWGWATLLTAVSVVCYVVADTWLLTSGAWLTLCALSLAGAAMLCALLVQRQSLATAFRPPEK